MVYILVINEIHSSLLLCIYIFAVSHSIRPLLSAYDPFSLTSFILGYCTIFIFSLLGSKKELTSQSRELPVHVYIIIIKEVALDCRCK